MEDSNIIYTYVYMLIYIAVFGAFSKAEVTVDAGGPYIVREGGELRLECQINGVDFTDQGASLGWKRATSGNDIFTHILNNASDKVIRSSQPGAGQMLTYQERFAAIASDSGSYFCFYKKFPAKVNSDWTQVTVTVHPEIVFNTPTFVTAPRIQTLQCEVQRAYPNFYMTLKVRGDNIHKVRFGSLVNYTYTGTMEREVTFSESDTKYKLEIECTVVWMKADHNETTTVTRSVALHYPAYTAVQKDEEASEALFLSCKLLSGSPPNGTTIWYHNGTTIDPSRPEWSTFIISGDKLVAQKTSRMPDGVICCIVDNGVPGSLCKLPYRHSRADFTLKKPDETLKSNTSSNANTLSVAGSMVVSCLCLIMLGLIIYWRRNGAANRSSAAGGVHSSPGTSSSSNRSRRGSATAPYEEITESGRTSDPPYATTSVMTANGRFPRQDVSTFRYSHLGQVNIAEVPLYSHLREGEDYSEVNAVSAAPPNDYSQLGAKPGTIPPKGRHTE